MSSKPAAVPGVFKHDRMLQLAKKRGLTNKDLAEAVQVNQGTVGRWAKGEAAPSPRFIARLAEVLKVSPSQLYVVAAESDRNLAYYRVLAGYSLAQLAPKLDTSSVHLNRMEAGRSPVPEKIVIQLCELLNLTEDQLHRAIRRSQLVKGRSGRYQIMDSPKPQLIGA